MKARRRRLIFSKIEFGAPVAARCSVCHRPFEAAFDEQMTLGAAHGKLAEMFDAHVCNEDANQTAAQTVRESTER